MASAAGLPRPSLVRLVAVSVLFLMVADCAQKKTSTSAPVPAADAVASWRDEARLPADVCEIDTDHVVKVSRRFSSRAEALAIATAEARYPGRDEVVASFEPAHVLDEIGLRKDRDYDWFEDVEAQYAADRRSRARRWYDSGRLWWCSDFDYVLIAYAVTREAVDYYSDLVRDLRTTRRHPFADPETKQASSLKYSASARHMAEFTMGGLEFTDVIVVEMELEFSASFASLAAVGFHRKRTVIVSSAGLEVLAVFGDGPPEYWVS